MSEWYMLACAQEVTGNGHWDVRLYITVLNRGHSACATTGRMSPHWALKWFGPVNQRSACSSQCQYDPPRDPQHSRPAGPRTLIVGHNLRSLWLATVLSNIRELLQSAGFCTDLLPSCPCSGGSWGNGPASACGQASSHDEWNHMAYDGFVVHDTCARACSELLRPRRRLRGSLALHFTSVQSDLPCFKGRHVQARANTMSRASRPWSFWPVLLVI